MCWQKANKQFPQHSHSKAGHALLLQPWLIPLQMFPSFMCLQLHGAEAYDQTLLLISSCPVSSLSWSGASQGLHQMSVMELT